MKKQLLFIQGGGEGAYVEDAKLVDSLRDALGADYNVIYPPMPHEEAPDYEAWKGQIAAELAGLSDDVILVGHSLGGSFLVKYLAEETLKQTVAGLFLIAPPYWGAEDWEVEAYAPREGFASKLAHIPHIAFYHSREDEWVPFAHQALYAQKLPQAKTHEFDGRGHQLNDDLSEVAHDIKSLAG
jgi:uncharacterized protein